MVTRKETKAMDITGSTSRRRRGRTSWDHDVANALNEGHAFTAEIQDRKNIAPTAALGFKYMQWNCRTLIYTNFLCELLKNRLNANKKILTVTRRAGCLILGSKSNTVSEMYASGGLATYR